MRPRHSHLRLSGTCLESAALLALASSGGGFGALGLANLMRGRLALVVGSCGGGGVVVHSSPPVITSVAGSTDEGLGGGDGIGLGGGGIGAELGAPAGFGGTRAPALRRGLTNQPVRQNSSASVRALVAPN